MNLCAEDSGLEKVDFTKIVPFSFQRDDTLVETAKLLTILIVHILKSPVIVTPTFVETIVSFLKNQSNHSKDAPPPSTPLDIDHYVESLSTLNTIRALCIPGLYHGIAEATRITNMIIQAINSGEDGGGHIEEIQTLLNRTAPCPSLPYQSGGVRQKEPGSWIFDSSIGPIQVRPLHLLILIFSFMTVFLLCYYR